MLIRARAVAVSGALLAAFALAVPAGTAAQDKKKEQKLDKDQQREVQTVVKIVDEVVAGQPAPTDFPITFQYHFQKARDQRTFMPVTMVFPQDRITNTSVVYYVRVVPRGGAATAPEGNGEKDAKQDEKKGRPEYPFEDVRFFDLKAPENGQYRVTRAISVPPGEFDLYVLMGERTPKDKKAEAPKRSLVKQAVTVPDFWANELMTSSIILSNKAEQLSAPPSEADMAANPYVFGLTRLTPSLDHKFSKKDELSIIFLIYNTAAAQGGKPDVKVEYNFHQKQAGGGEKFFNRTEPQNFNAQTLPPQFDAAAGHQLVGGLSIPLASFPEGDYRLEIKITDVAGNNKTKTENVDLSIAP
ncbi:MAG TPA: hypothetical protein PKK95_11255 [Vicinamibacterales bacterium]|nr:hypothetical protein [Acidobacteriota bacterium]HOC18840.1 hypothetical protein [Vicinamibacterales bacterium]